MKKRTVIKGIFFGTVIAALLAAAGGFTFLTVNEYVPEETEAIAVNGSKTKRIYAGDTVTAVTYSVGYGIHDSGYDCVLEGGSSAKALDKTTVEDNISYIADEIKSVNPDIVFLQEVDRNSARSYYCDESEMLVTEMKVFNSAFASDHLCSYVVQGSLGEVDAGIQTLSKLHYVDNAERISLHDNDQWPAGTMSMKECMLVERIELEESTKQLVLVNVHLTDSEMNLDQYKELANFMQLEFAKGNYVIAGGNFNAMLPSVNAKLYPETKENGSCPEQLPMSVLTGGWKYCTDDSVPSARRCDKKYEDNEKNVQTYYIDGLITSPNTLVSEIKTIDTSFASAAHNPVSVKVTLVK